LWDDAEPWRIALAVNDIAGNTVVQQFDYAHPFDLPTMVLSPATTSLLSATTPLQVTFSRSMDPASLALSGTLVAGALQILWTQALVPNDRLTVTPSLSWPQGVGQDLTINATDTSGVAMAPVTAVYHVDAIAPTWLSAPAAGGVLGDTDVVVLQFSESMATGAVGLGGTLYAENDGWLWSSTVYNNDTLTISKSSAWNADPRTLSGTFEDLAGNAVNISLTFAARYLRAFITSASGTANLSTWADAGTNTGLAAGDTICQTRAAATGLEGTFVAWLSDSHDDAYCRVQGLTGLKSDNCGQATLPASAGPWMGTDGLPYAATIDLMILHYVYTPLWHDEFGQQLSPDRWVLTGTVWTGAGSLDCSGWTSEIDLVTTGRPAATGGARSNSTTNSCSITGHLYCFESGAGPDLPPTPVVGKRAFVSSSVGTGDFKSWIASSSTGAQVGDEICVSLAAARNLPNSSRFKAWLSEPGIDAADRLVSDGPWVRLDGTLIAANKAELVSGVLRTSVAMTEQGIYYTSREVWTGTLSDGRLAANHCDGWTSSSSSNTGLNRSGRVRRRQLDRNQ
jgi:hypothetical protein